MLTCGMDVPWVAGRRPVTAPVVPLRPAGDGGAAAREALAAVHRHLDRCKLPASTVKAYKRHTTAYVAWLAGHADQVGDAFADLVRALKEQRSEKYRHALIAVVSIVVRAGQLGRDRCLALVPPGISRMNMSAVIKLVTCRNSR